jgi:integrase/recombinase XerD
MWLHGRSPHTRRAYRAAVDRFRAFTLDKPFAAVTVANLQDFADSIAGELEPSSQSTMLSAVRSLFSYAHKRLGYLSMNVGAPLELPKVKNTLAARILSELEVHRMLALSSGRDAVLLRLLYSGGLRVSELCGLCWRDAQEREDAGQLTVFGKGGKTRVVLLSADTWAALVDMQRDAGADHPVFRSRKGGGHLDPSHVRKIVLAAARLAGIEGNVSPHWLRHSHASHSLDRGAPIHLVQATLGHVSVVTTGRYLHARPSDSSSRYLTV